MVRKPVKVIKLNPSEQNLWKNGSYTFIKCSYKLRVSFELNEKVEIRNSSNQKIGYAKVIAVQKHQSSFAPLFEAGSFYQEAFEANMPPAPLITLLVFELLEGWEGMK